MKNFSMILATDSKNGIWVNNTLAWSLKKDMSFFKKLSTQTEDKKKCNAVIMGRKTWESIPPKFRPLPWRINCILSHSIWLNLEWAIVFNDFDECLEQLSYNQEVENIFVIWWAHLYNTLIHHPQLESIHMTNIEQDFWCDTFFTGIPQSFFLHTFSTTQVENDTEFQFCKYKKTQEV